MAAQVQKMLSLREQYESASRAFHARRGFPTERDERQVIGRYKTLDWVIGNMTAIREGMKPTEWQPLVEDLLDRLVEDKATWIVNFIRERRKHGINELGEWMAEGAIAQIDEIAMQLLARLSPRWHKASTKNLGRIFHVYHSLRLDTLVDIAIGKHQWFGSERAQWYQEVALIRLAKAEDQLEEVFRLTNHIDEQGWHTNQEVLFSSVLAYGVDPFESPQIPRSTSVGDILVSMLTGAAWIVDHIGFQALAQPDQGRPNRECDAEADRGEGAENA